MTECALYRHFDADGVLLYVGITKCAIKRTRSHEKQSVWSRQIARIDIEWFDTRADAIEAERIAITTEKPIWNIVHNTSPQSIKLPERISNASFTEPIDIEAERKRIYQNVPQGSEHITARIIAYAIGTNSVSNFVSRHGKDCRLPEMVCTGGFTYRMDVNHARYFVENFQPDYISDFNRFIADGYQSGNLNRSRSPEEQDQILKERGLVSAVTGMKFLRTVWGDHTSPRRNGLVPDTENAYIGGLRGFKRNDLITCMKQMNGVMARHGYDYQIPDQAI